MAVLKVGDVCIGKGRPKTIVSLMDGTREGLADTCQRALADGADLLEWRADFWPAVHDQQQVAETCAYLCELLGPATPLIFTCRTAGQGGEAQMDAEEYADLLACVLTQAKPGLVDIELSVGDAAVSHLIERAHECGAAAIVSQHDFEATPPVDDMVATLQHMIELGADIPKLAVMARRSQDAHALMRATHVVYEQADVPLVTMAMGTAGQTTRLTGEVFGSAMTFCALGKASAPGQVELKNALVTLDAIHRDRMANHAAQRYDRPHQP